METRRSSYLARTLSRTKRCCQSCATYRRGRVPVRHRQNLPPKPEKPQPKLLGDLEVERDGHVQCMRALENKVALAKFASFLGCSRERPLLCYSSEAYRRPPASRHSAAQFPWLLAAFISLVATHAVFWSVTQSVNRYWLKDQELGVVGGKFFDCGRPIEAFTSGLRVLFIRYDRQCRLWAILLRRARAKATQTRPATHSSAR